MLADSGIEFTDVPPRITPTLNVVFGDAGTGVSAQRLNRSRQRDDRIRRAEIAPRMPARPAHNHLKTAAAQGLRNHRI